MPKNGFAPVIIIILVAVLLIGSIVFISSETNLFIAGRPKDKSSPVQNFQHREENKSYSQAEWPQLWGPPDNQNKCQKKTDVKYTALPIALENIKFVQPIGELREGHVIPGDHGGFDYKTSPTSTPVKVFMPADGFLVRVEKHPYDPPPGYPKNLQHYHIYLEHSCTFFTGFVHLTEFAPDLLAANQELIQLTKDRSTQQKQTLFRIPLKAGQQIGTAWSFGLLGMVTVDLTHTNKGYLNPESYIKAENWRVHSVAGLEYFEASLKDQMMAKNPRTVEPRGGKIDYDIVGKLVGNWFQEGTGGLRDVTVKPKQCGNFPCPYWEGHLALVYDYIDSSQLRLSVGYNSGLAGRTPFGVKGNSPDFKDIGVADGLVKYEIVALKDISKEKGYDAESSLVTINDESQILGTMLVQLADNNTLRMEIFPGKNKDQVSAFTSQARVYRR